MKESVVGCLYLKNATALAHEKGLLPKNQLLKCEYQGVCDKVDCIKLSEPNYRTIHLKQGNMDDSFSPKDKFYSKLDKWKSIISNNRS